ncbi:conjugative transfer signal peptidase TraF (plasmid) [Synechocystis sp. B12]|nr:conjugative transfer signal peptidase TraF [Synechocystis sp. B12]
MTANQRFLMWTFGAATAVLAASVPFYAAGYRINETESLPRGVWQLAEPTFKRGEIVSFCPDTRLPAIRDAIAREYLRAGSCDSGIEPMFKTIVGLPGDLVELSAAGVRINGSEPMPNTAPRSADGNGKPLRQQPAKQVVGAASFFVVSDYSPWSYDSRYFGPIDRASVLGAASPVWLWERSDD